MAELVRFGVSLDKELLKKFDEKIKEEYYSNRSGAIADLIRNKLIEEEWKKDEETAGSITIVFNHNERELTQTLTNIQHEHHHYIISSQHIHLDHDNCFEIIIVKGKPTALRKLCSKLRSAKGVIHANLNLATTGELA